MNLLLKYNQYLKQVFPTQALVSKINDIDKVKFTITKDKQIKQHYIGGEQPKIEDKKEDEREDDFELKYIENNNIIIIGGISSDNVIISQPASMSFKKENIKKENIEKKNTKKENIEKKNTKYTKTIHVSCLNGDDCKNKLIEDLKSKYDNLDDKINIIFTETYYFDDGEFKFNVPDADYLFYIPCMNYEHLISHFINDDPKLIKKLKKTNNLDEKDKKKQEKYNKRKIEKYLTSKKNELNNYHSNVGYVELNPEYDEIHNLLIKLY